MIDDQDSEDLVGVVGEGFCVGLHVLGSEWEFGKVFFVVELVVVLVKVRLKDTVGEEISHVGYQVSGLLMEEFDVVHNLFLLPFVHNQNFVVQTPVMKNNLVSLDQ